MKFIPQQFRSTQRISPGAYSVAAQNLTKAANNLYEINRKTAPDYSGLALTQMNINKALAKKGIETESALTKAGILVKGQLQKEKEILKGQETVRNAKRAGRLMLFGGGALMQGMKMAGRKKIDKPEPIYGVETPFKYPDSPYKKQIEGSNGSNLGPAPTRPDPEDPSTWNTTLPQVPNNNSGTMDTPPATPTYDQPPAEVRSQSTGQTFNKPQLKQMALDAGFPADVAPTIARIAMGESSGNSHAFNGKGADQSYGLLQVNMLGDMGPERRAKYGLTSNEDLFDPATNMRVAKGIYDSQGLGAWGAYTNGSYLNY